MFSVAHGFKKIPQVPVSRASVRSQCNIAAAVIKTVAPLPKITSRPVAIPSPYRGSAAARRLRGFARKPGPRYTASRMPTRMSGA